MKTRYTKTENSITIAKLESLMKILSDRQVANADDEAIFCALRSVRHRIEDCVNELYNLHGAL